MDVKIARRDSLQALLEEDSGPERGKKRRLAARIGKSPAQISQWQSGFRTIEEETAREIERRAGKSPGWLDRKHATGVTELLAREPNAARHQHEGVSHDLRHQTPQTVPTIEWESLVNASDQLPEVFYLTMPDDSMHPRMARGEPLYLSIKLDPLPGDDVLVADNAGNLYIREYRERSPGHWIAQPVNEAFLPLESQRDGLRALAVVLEHTRRRRAARNT